MQEGLAGFCKKKMDSVELDIQLAEVSVLFPDADMNAVKRDLSFTKNAEETVNRILDGRVRQHFGNTSEQS